MTSFFSFVKVILALLPIIIQAVNAIEEAFPEGGKGAEKLEVIKGALQKSYEVVGDASIKFEQIWPVISVVISSVVLLAKKAPAK